MSEPELRALMAASIFPALYGRIAAAYGDTVQARNEAAIQARCIARAILRAERDEYDGRTPPLNLPAHD